MWSPNEISKQEKQRDIFAYITLPFFQIKKGSLSTFRFCFEFLTENKHHLIVGRGLATAAPN